jgi:UDP-N-acetylmuramoyl-L-alanyl-D-glutamate--2,6-diaminopimelate ligase
MPTRCYHKKDNPEFLYMEGFKKQLKQAVPEPLVKHLLNPYHLAEAVAANARHGFPARGMQVVMVTGTNGKTTTVSFIASILKAAGYKVGVCSTAYFEINGERIANDLNFTVTNPFKLQAMLARMKQANVEYLVLEVTSHALAQHRVWGVPCDVAVMTNLTQDHLDYHGTMENYAAAKGKLFARRPKYIVLNRDDQWFEFFNQYEAGEQKITYGTDEAADARIERVRLHKDGSDVRLAIDHQVEIRFATNMPGKFNVYNATAAAATAYVMRVDVEHIQRGIEALEGVPGRLERIDEGQPFDVVVDYAHTPDALENLFETLKHLTKKRLIVVFGATGDRDKGKRPIMGGVAVKYADHIFLTDDESYSEDPASIRQMVMEGIEQAGGQDKTTELGDRREAISRAVAMAKRGDTVVITGMGHEQYRIVDGKRLPWHEPTVVRELLVKL